MVAAFALSGRIPAREAQSAFCANLAERAVLLLLAAADDMTFQPERADAPHHDEGWDQALFEEAGEGTPVIFVHEYAGDLRTWEPQMRFFSRLHRCVTYCSARLSALRRAHRSRPLRPGLARDDVIALMDALGIEKAHVVGHSMGALTALLSASLSAALPERHRRRLRLWLEPRSDGRRSKARAASRETAEMFETEDFVLAAARTMPTAPPGRRTSTRTRAALPNSPAMLAEHSAQGHASPCANCRPSVRPCGSCKRTETVFVAAACSRRRRRRLVPGIERFLEAHRADRRACRYPALRPHHYQRGAGRLQRGARRSLRERCRRPLDGASGYRIAAHAAVRAAWLGLTMTAGVRTASRANSAWRVPHAGARHFAARTSCCMSTTCGAHAQPSGMQGRTA